MKTKLTRSVLALLSAFALSTQATSAQAPAATCEAPDSWFPSTQTQPFDPSTFPGDSATNCDFHQWSWQTFLWLTQDVKGRMRFMTFPGEADLFNPADFTREPALLAEVMKTPKARIQLRVRAVKSKDSALTNADSIAQAGGGGVLVDQNGFPVFYSVHFDPVFYEFVRKNGYYKFDTYIKADPTTTFPLGAMELKASWRIVQAGEDTSAVYTTDADVPVLEQDDKGNVTAVPGKTRPVKVAFVGIHIVGIVAHHPEFIWATFEHSGNAPEKADVPSATGSTFYAANTAAADCLVDAHRSGKLKLDPASQTFTPVTQVYRTNPNGDKPGTPNSANITALNASVNAKLESGAVWKNYDLIGGLWLLPDSLTPAGIDDSKLRGSLPLANTTMETYHQTINCFACHGTDGPPGVPNMNMNLSHILTDGLLKNQQAMKDKAKAKAAGKEDPAGKETEKPAR